MDDGWLAVSTNVSTKDGRRLHPYMHACMHDEIDDDDNEIYIILYTIL
jgi:hypothetical protein